jgi:hypothetical protein
MTWIQTFTGRAVDLLEPDPASFVIEDIAHALARICRYTGHSPEHYSVAQHSVLVARNLPLELRFDGLMHDAVEAYVQDVSAPLKWAMRGSATNSAYDIVEARIDVTIAKQFGLIRPLPPEVKVADLRMLATEADDLGFLGGAPRSWRLSHARFPDRIECWPFEKARDAFLGEYERLAP